MSAEAGSRSSAEAGSRSSAATGVGRRRGIGGQQRTTPGYRWTAEDAWRTYATPSRPLSADTQRGLSDSADTRGELSVVARRPSARFNSEVFLHDLVTGAREWSSLVLKF